MGKELGFVKIFRSLKNWEWSDNPNVLALFIHLLLMANYTDQRWQGQTIKRGQLVTSIGSLSQKTGLSVRQVRTCLQKLKSTGEVTSRTTNRFTVITVMNWGKYQCEDEVTTSNATSNATNRWQTDGKQMTNERQHYKKDKKDKKDKNSNSSALTDNKITMLYEKPCYQKFYEENIGIMTPHIRAEADSYVEDGMEPELLTRAMQKAVDNNCKKWTYIKAILNSWLELGIKTASAAHAENLDFENQRQGVLDYADKQRADTGYKAPRIKERI